MPDKLGLFVTFEGIDGSGKSTQLTLLAQTLSRLGVPHLVTRNPGGTELGKEIRQMLLHHPGHVDPTCELLLYMADRAQHQAQVVLPALAAGQIVLCDRHGDSTLAYQGYGRGLPLALIRSLNATATQGRLPDLTLLFDGPVDVLANRVAQRGEADRLEREALTFRQKVRQGYLNLAMADTERVRILDATEPVEALQQQVLALIQAACEERGVSLQPQQSPTPAGSS
jgi:dTMP kinase